MQYPILDPYDLQLQVDQQVIDQSKKAFITKLILSQNHKQLLKLILIFFYLFLVLFLINKCVIKNSSDLGKNLVIVYI